ncbi:MAG: hypothetical protein F6J97_26940, partial [Leptolyngbya sp. SIO4C1]|nr:hypothetical protein [Leptolyngbya sp. SIO4C1]
RTQAQIDQMQPLEPDESLRSHRVLQQATRDEEWVVRYAAVVGLQDLAQAFRQHDPQPAELLSQLDRQLQIVVAEDDTLAVQARAQWARQQLSP